MSQGLDALAGNALVPGVDARNAEGARDAAIDAGMATRDLELQYRPSPKSTAPVSTSGASSSSSTAQASKPTPATSPATSRR
jgi:hypothetical protein